jgi:hypothetical protein
MSSHEFVESPLYRTRRITRKIHRLMSADPLIENVGNEFLFADAEKLALLREPLELH